MEISIFPIPFKFESKGNEYLNLLYNNVNGGVVGPHSFRVGTCKLKEIWTSRRRREAEICVIHVHWSRCLYESRYVLKSIYLLAINFSILALLKKRYGYKVYWTMHNFKSHDYPHPSIDWLGRKLLYSITDCIIIQQRGFYEVLSAQRRDKTFVYMPHGNYVGTYGPVQEAGSMKKQLGFDEEDIIMISLGTVMPYKKIDRIIEVLNKNDHILDKRLKLFIAGRCEPEYANYLLKLTSASHRIVFRNEFVQDNDLALYLSVADYSVFWYDDSVLTSGGLTLSLSYGVPVIARDIYASDLVQRGRNGFLFDTPESLAEILIQLPTLDKPRQEDVISSVTHLDWQPIANRLMKVFAGQYLEVY
ncbi:MAG: glycosyltransferase [Deltaproteobacteria bacterium]